MRAKIKVGDLIYHKFSHSYGWVVEVGEPTIHITKPDTIVEWTSGKRTSNFYVTVVEWKQNADEEKKKLDREKEVR